MRFVSKKAIRKDGKHQKTVFWSLACLLCIVTSLYVYLVNTAAWNGIRWKKAGQEVAPRKYPSLRHAISRSKSQSRFPAHTRWDLKTRAQCDSLRRKKSAP